MILSVMDVVSLLVMQIVGESIAIKLAQSVFRTYPNVSVLVLYDTIDERTGQFARCE